MTGSKAQTGHEYGIRDLCMLHNHHEVFCPSVITVTIHPHRFERATFPFDLDSRYFFPFSAISVPATPPGEGNSPQRWRDLAATIERRNRTHHLSVTLTIGSLSHASPTAGFWPAGEDGRLFVPPTSFSGYRAVFHGFRGANGTSDASQVNE